MFNKIFFLIFFCTLCFQSNDGANILFVTVTPSHSHQSVFRPIWKELSLRGHNVHVLTTHPHNDPKLKNLTEYDVSSVGPALRSKIPPDMAMYLIKKPDFLTVFLKDSIMTKYWSMLQEEVLKHENTKRLIKGNHKFDVVVVEWLYPTMAGFAAKYGAPLVGITSLGAPIPAMDTVGNPSHPIISPDMNLPVTRDMNFRERLMSALYNIYVRAYYHWAVLPREDKLIKKYLGNDLPYLGDIERNISLLILNRNPVFHRPMPMVPAIIELGGIKIAKEKQTLDPQLKKFLDTSKNGFIYFSLGSAIRFEYISQKIKDELVKTFAQLPYNVVWKTDEENVANKPKNVLLQKWVAQTELLKHPNLKLFIMQGGLQSSEEAIENQVPIIGIPFQSDQTANVDTFVKYGMGLSIDLEDITVERLNASIHEVISKTSYKENAIRLSQLLYDKPMDGLDRAVWWIEYVIRHKGAKHLRIHAMDVPWYQILLLDVIGFILAVLLFVLVILYLIVKIVLKLLRTICSWVCSIFCCSKKQQKKSKTQ